ncbi:LuxR C-terminal-related transcriptional regulator [Streptomyces sp. NPDC005805]|uniref:helix-turn-helix transcriptional regulator n=1 Tax=Streptomyces sp. NPDC005805 TaxID=3157068 RepID=UPI0033F07E65
MTTTPPTGRVRGRTGHGGRWPFAARQQELDAFEVFLDDPATTAVLIHGGAGCGKSRLAEECLRRAAGHARRTEHATATAAAARMPLGALAHLLPAAVGRQDPVATFQAASAALGPAAAGASRTVLLVDDLHLLDSTSVMLLGHLLHNRLVFLVATLRDGVPHSDMLESIDRQEGTRRLALTPFSREEVSEVLRQALDGPVEHATLEVLTRASGGNALCLHELVNGALAARRFECLHGVWRLSGPPVGTDRLSEIVGSRLAGLSPDQRTLLETVALCEPVPLHSVRRQARTEDLEALEREGLVRLVTAGLRTECVLGHPMYGEVVEASITECRRREVHAEQVRLMERHGGRRREDTLRLATWRLAAGLDVEPELLLPAAALARHAHDWNGVLALLGALPEGSETFQVWMMSGEAHHHQGRWGAADRSLAAAQALAADEHQLIVAVMERTQNAFWGFGDTSRTFRITAEAARGMSDAGRAVLRVNDGAFLLYCGRVANALDMLADVDEVPVDRVRMWGQLQRALALSYSGRTAEAADLSAAVHRELASAALSGGPVDASSHRSSPAIYRVAALVDAGRLEEAREVGERAFAEAVSDQVAAPQCWIACHLGRCELIAGRLHAAHRWFAEAAALSQSHRYPRTRTLAHSGLAAVRAQQGDATGARRALAEADATPADQQQAVLLVLELARAWCRAASGDLPGARDVLTKAAARARATGVHSYEAWLLAEAARLGGERQTADRLAELHADGDALTVRVWAERARALLHGDQESLGVAAEQCAAAGLDLLAAETAAAAAEAARREGDDRASAAWQMRSRRALRPCGTARTPALRNSTARPLTRREREIAGLARDRLSSQEIAARLVLSVRTVENHLLRIYAKLGISSRRELARALAALE